MTNDELYSILRRYLLTDGVAQHALSLIWGQPFDGETEKIKPTTEDSSATPTIANEADFVTKSMTADENETWETLCRNRYQPIIPDPLADMRARAEAGDRHAQTTLGDAYAHGMEVAQDCAESDRWYAMASAPRPTEDAQ